jgi:hypothetical protein
VIGTLLLAFLPAELVALVWVVAVLWVAQSTRSAQRRFEAERARLHEQFAAIVAASLADLQHIGEETEQ